MWDSYYEHETEISELSCIAIRDGVSHHRSCQIAKLVFMYYTFIFNHPNIKHKVCLIVSFSSKQQIGSLLS